MKEFDTNEEIMYALIIDDLDATISADDKEILEHWRKASSANEKVYQEFLNVHVNMDKLFEKRGYDVQSSWEVLDKKISLSAEEVPVVSMRSQKAKLWFSIAAAILVVLSVGYYFAFTNRYEVISTGSKGAYIFLPDHTRVDLNSATSIRYNKHDFINDRKLELLKGEVFINVTNHKLPQFKVVLGDIEAVDIGTSFNIVKTSSAIHVIVESGKVALTQASLEKEVLLTPGKLGMYDVNTKVLAATDNLDPNYKAWINKEFVFNEVALAEVADQLSKVYKQPIVIDGNDLKNRKLTAKLHYQTLDSAIAVISASLQCKAIKSKDTYVISVD
ncbi:MAG: FecR family protein [Candidatus Pedobacter colombiensis]|uniref:FecR family protein n=1 Tax=Candidatus Pedobacter colombiensis TaxID=3121371 RepID=A0AAJ6B947_9SPHI|nr:FecR family protein [Pedobacter sp.]WEK21559.1 MAG: FecR family protein [Pedobacter sp.]